MAIIKAAVWFLRVVTNYPELNGDIYGTPALYIH